MENKVCQSFNKVCQSFNKVCQSFNKVCQSFNKVYQSFKSNRKENKLCQSFNKVCQSFNTAGHEGTEPKVTTEEREVQHAINFLIIQHNCDEQTLNLKQFSWHQTKPESIQRAKACLSFSQYCQWWEDSESEVALQLSKWQLTGKERMSVNHSMLLGQVLWGTAAIKLKCESDQKREGWVLVSQHSWKGLCVTGFKTKPRHDHTHTKRKNRKQTSPSVTTDDDEGVVSLKWFCCQHPEPESDTATTNRYQSIKNTPVETAVKRACQWMPVLSPTHSPIFVELYCKARHGLHGFVGKRQLHKYLSASPCECTVDF